MITLDKIRQSRFLCFKSNEVLLSRRIYIYDNIELDQESDTQIIYKLAVTDYMQRRIELKLIHDIQAKCWYTYLTESNIRHELYQVSCVLAEILKNQDEIVYKFPDREERIKVPVKIFAHNHIVCYTNQDRDHGHNLKTMLSRWDESYIVGIYTYDNRRSSKL